MDNIKYSVGKKLQFKKVIAYRKRIVQSEANEMLNIFENYIEYNKLKKVSPFINVTHGIETKNNNVYMDIEIMVAIEELSKVQSNSEVRVIDNFTLNNALLCEIKCSPLVLGSYNSKIEQYIEQMEYCPVTPGYLISKKISNDVLYNEMEYHLYIGLKCNEKNFL
ncbi:MAG: hypothetical protein II838_06590 [Lachnospiraceae bacterium]|nr:hypothetical protein [Lachnospiraceae bacterium]